jgi:hypothetical protein
MAGSRGADALALHADDPGSTLAALVSRGPGLRARCYEFQAAARRLEPGQGPSSSDPPKTQHSSASPGAKRGSRGSKRGRNWLSLGGIRRTGARRV